MARKIILSCEHASSKIPSEFASYFKDASLYLKSHQGFDAGAQEVCVELKHLLTGSMDFYGQWSRLLVDLNRSSTKHPKVFSTWTQVLSPLQKATLLEEIHQPYRTQVFEAVQGAFTQGDSVLHLSIHSFTPKLGEQVRNNDVGLLYDPRRSRELAFAKQWEKNLSPEIRVRRNYPYRGSSDGHTTALRKKIPRDYLGIEVELNQAFLNKHSAQTVAELLVSSLPKD